MDARKSDPNVQLEVMEQSIELILHGILKN